MICYLIMPQGISEDLSEGLNALSEKHDITMVLVKEVNWNDDLTPWPAPGVFKKAKPYGGQASTFLERLTGEILPETERTLKIHDEQRTLVGVSLSGLFALWAGYHTDAFSNIISISGSLWYDGFTDWMSDHTINPKVRQVCMLLGDREKISKEKRMASVEENTAKAAAILENQCHTTFELVEGTHFSPIMPRLERAFELLKF